MTTTPAEPEHDEPTEADERRFGIKRAWVYRRHDAETLKILGLGDTAVEDEIKKGNIDPPMPLTEHGKAAGWLGSALIKMQKKRLERAAARLANPPRPNTNTMKKQR